MSEHVRHDPGGWISGPSATPEPVSARDIIPGDVIAHEGLVVTVTGTRHRRYWFDGPEKEDGVAIDWDAGGKGGRMFRRLTDTLERLGGR